MKHFALLLHVIFRFTLIAILALTALMPLLYETTPLTAFVYMPLLLVAIAIVNLAADNLLMKMVPSNNRHKTAHSRFFSGKHCFFCSLY